MKHATHEPIKITEHLYQLGTFSFPAYLSIGEEIMIIEGGTGPTANIIAGQIEALGVDPQKIKHMALTHTHPDHIGGIPRLRKHWPDMAIVAGPTAAKVLKRETLLDEFLPTDHMIEKILMKNGEIEKGPAPMDKYEFHADRIIEEGEHIDLGNGIRWRAFSTPGHSLCHISYYEEKEDVLVIGDTTGFYDRQRDVFWPNYFYSLAEYCNSIRKMIDLPAKIGLLSHNGVIENDVLGYLTKAMQATEGYHYEILKRTSNGERDEEVIKDKADWVVSLGPLASYKAILFLNRMLLQRSQKEKEMVRFLLPEAMTA